MKNKSLIVAVVAFLVICAAALTVYFAILPQPQEGSKLVTIEVVYPDGNTKEFNVRTNGEYLSDALVESKLVSAEEASFFSTVDGVYADWDKDQAYWCIMKSGEVCMLGASQLAIVDGDHYELVYTTGYSFE